MNTVQEIKMEHQYLFFLLKSVEALEKYNSKNGNHQCMSNIKV